MAKKLESKEIGMRKTPGRSWRTNSSLDGSFDELVIDDWFHLERMDDRRWWIGIGDWHINIYVPRDPTKPPVVSCEHHG